MTVWDVSTLVYEGGQFSVTAQDTYPLDVFLKSDGTKMYVLGDTNDRVFQYTLSTAWDVTTASYDSLSASLSAQGTSPRGIFFKPDGTKLYTVDGAQVKVFQYSLSTAWDVSTASYDSVSFSTSASTSSNPSSLSFSSDGTKMHVVGSTTDAVFQYTLATAWDLATASYDSVSKATAPTHSDPYGVVFKSDGTKMYVSDLKNVYQYALSTAWDVGTASYESKLLDASQTTSPFGMFFKPTGAKLYIAGFGNDAVYEYVTDEPVTSRGWTLGAMAFN